MGHRKLMPVFVTGLMIALMILSTNPLRAQATEKVLYRFQGGHLDGQAPQTAVLVGSDGNLYGTTPYGGGNGKCAPNGTLSYCGVVFQLSPVSGGAWKEKVIYRFSGRSDGGEPSSLLVPDSAGNLIGTTTIGGALETCEVGEGCGTVFELSPSGSDWTQSVLYAFSWGPGLWPRGVILDPSGNLYGSTLDTVFELKPKKAGGWSQLLLYEFGIGNDTAGGVVRDTSGNLYGTTGNQVFELTSGANGWTESVIGTGLAIFGGPVMDGNGNLFFIDNSAGNGIVELSPSQNGWQQSLVYTFKGAPDGEAPTGNLAIDGAGNIYGTTGVGGTGHCGIGSSIGCGTVYKLTPSASGWTETVLYSFPGGPEGYFPLSGVVLDSAGNLYGTTNFGGGGNCIGSRGNVVGCGVVFEVTP